MPAAASIRPEPTARWRPFGWLAGIPVLAVLWAASSHVVAPVVSDALLGQGAGIVRQSGSGEGAGEPWLRLETSGRDLVALGEASDAARRNAALAQLAALPGLRRLIDATGAVEDVSPFVWQARTEPDGRIALTGHRPTGIGAVALAERLGTLLPAGTELIDHARAARGGPPDFADAAAYAVERLRGLKPGATVTLTDTVLSFDGEAADPAAYDALRTALAAPPQGFTIGMAEIAPPVIEAYRLVVERKPDGTTILGGHVVSEASRADLREAAAEIAAGAAVEDRTQTARGLPETVDPSALGRLALRLAGLLGEGAVRFESGVLSVSGLAIDAQAVAEASAILRDARPAGVAAGAIDLTARPVSPYRLRLRREAGSVVVTGHLPDEGSRAALLGTLRAKFFHDPINDRSRIADGAPSGLLDAVTAATGPLATLSAGEIAVSDRALTLSGASLYAQSAERLNAALPRALPAGWTASIRIAASDAAERFDPPTCTRLFTERVASRSLRFAPGSSELTPDFFPLLDAAADLARHCPTARIEVAGHADAAGTPPQPPKPLPEYTSSIREPEKAKKPGKEAGKETGKKAEAKASAKAQAAKPEPKPAEPPAPLPDLPQQRALAVIDYLQKAGLSADRAVAVPPASAERREVGLAFRS